MLFLRSQVSLPLLRRIRADLIHPTIHPEGVPAASGGRARCCESIFLHWGLHGWVDRRLVGPSPLSRSSLVIASRRVKSQGASIRSLSASYERRAAGHADCWHLRHPFRLRTNLGHRRPCRCRPVRGVLTWHAAQASTLLAVDRRARSPPWRRAPGIDSCTAAVQLSCCSACLPLFVLVCTDLGTAQPVCRPEPRRLSLTAWC